MSEDYYFVAGFGLTKGNAIVEAIPFPSRNVMNWFGFTSAIESFCPLGHTISRRTTAFRARFA
jgi:hypothetical protein